MKRLLTAAGILTIPLLWFVASRIVGEYIVPSPWTTLLDTAVLLRSADTWATISTTLIRVIAGFSIAMVAGVAIGVLTAKQWVDHLFRPIILLMQGIPPILWSIPLILIMGFSELTPVVVIALICFPLAVTNVNEGMRTVPGELREMLEVYAPGFFPRLRELILPHLRPFFTAAVRLGLGLGIKASVVAEYFAANDGIGFEVQTAYQAFLVRRLFSWALVLILIILGIDLVVRQGIRFLDTAIARRRIKPDDTRLVNVAAIERRFRKVESDGGGILASGLNFAYEGQKALVQDAELSVEAGSIVVLSGDSGCGKTTLLKLVAGMLEPNSGVLSAPHSLGFMFQDDRFLPWLSSLDNTALALRYRGYSRIQSRAFARFLLGLVELEGSALALPSELSGGMKKRLGFARSFACIPGALLLDEPFTGLHHEARAELWARFTSLIELRPVPVIVVTHFPEEVPSGPNTRFYKVSGSPWRLSPG